MNDMINETLRTIFTNYSNTIQLTNIQYQNITDEIENYFDYCISYYSTINYINKIELYIKKITRDYENIKNEYRKDTYKNYNQLNDEIKQKIEAGYESLNGKYQTILATLMRFIKIKINELNEIIENI